MNSRVIVKVAVIANAVKQSMSLDCMGCRALACPEPVEGLAVTKALFKVRVLYLAGYGGLAMTKIAVFVDAQNCSWCTGRVPAFQHR
jgi:hypothetical protein